VNGPDDTRAWFSQAVEAQTSALYSVAMRLTRNDADAEDLVAEAVIAAWKSIDTLSDRGRFRPWLFRIMHNRFISDHRRRSVRPVETALHTGDGQNDAGEVCAYLVQQGDDFLDWWANPESEVINGMLGEQISAAIESLPEPFRLTVLLVNVDGLTYDEAAQALGVPAGTVRSRMKRGRTLLQKALWEIAVECGLRTAHPGGELES